MKIHEYQAKELFRKYNIPVPEGAPAFDAEEAYLAAEGLATLPVAVKAQVHAGGRGKRGGVRLIHSLDEVESAAAAMLAMHLVTSQTGPQGKKVTRLLVEEGLKIERELYLALLPDRSTAQIMVMASTGGGMDIEEMAAAAPEKIIRITVNPLTGIQPDHGRRIAAGLDLSPPLTEQFVSLLARLYRLFVEYDCSLVEINPLVITDDGALVALDAKIDIDANSLFRHPDIAAMRDPGEEDPLEAEAAGFNLNYIKLDGNIGNMVNGAGLAMATMDLIKQAGAEPANFLDVGGGASAEMVENGLRIILKDANVKGILINIFGGILRCDVLATGVVEAARKTNISVPLVIRMEGTNVGEGRRILADSGLNLVNAVDLHDAARKIAAIVKQ